MARLNRRVGAGIYGSRSTPEIDTNFGSDPTGTPIIPGIKQIIYMGQIYVPDPATGTYQPATGGAAVSQIATIDPPRANNLKTTAPAHPTAHFVISPHEDGTATYWERSDDASPFTFAGSTTERGAYVLPINRTTDTRNDPPSAAEITQALTDLGIDGPVEPGWSALVQLSDGTLERYITDDGTTFTRVQLQEPSAMQGAHHQPTASGDTYAASRGGTHVFVEVDQIADGTEAAPALFEVNIDDSATYIEGDTIVVQPQFGAAVISPTSTRRIRLNLGSTPLDNTGIADTYIDITEHAGVELRYDADGSFKSRFFGLPGTNPIYNTVDELLASTYLHKTDEAINVMYPEFTYRVADSAATDHDLTTAGGVKLYVLPCNGEYCVRQWNAKNDSNIFPQLQAAILKADQGRDEYFAPNVLIDLLFADVGGISHSRSDFSGGSRAITIRGLRHAFNNTGGGGTSLRQTNPNINAPIFAVHQGRDFVLKDLTLIGSANDQLRAIDPYNDISAQLIAGTLTGTIDDALEALFDDAIVAAGGVANRIHSPNCAVAIDAYVGAKPTITDGGGNVDAYDDSVIAYDVAGGTSFSKFENVTFKGFECAVANSPGIGDIQNDWQKMAGCRFEDCKYASSYSHSNHRSINFDNCITRNVWAALTGAAHGQQAGKMQGIWTGGGSGQFLGKIVDTQNFGQVSNLTFQGAAFESLYRIGDATASVSGGELLFDNCEIKEYRQQISPASYFRNAGASSGGSIRFDGCRFDVVGVCSFNGITLITNGTRMRIQGDYGTSALLATMKDYMRQALNGLGGYICGNFAEGDQVNNKWTPLGLGGADDGPAAQMTGSEYMMTGRDYGAPLVGRNLGRQRIQGSHPVTASKHDTVSPNRVISFVGSGNVSNITHVAGTRTITLDLSYSYNESNWIQRGYLPGSVVINQATNTHLAIRSVNTTTGTLTLELLNNWWYDGVNYHLIDEDVLLNDAGYNWIFAAVPYLAPQPLVGDIKSTDPAIPQDWVGINDYAPDQVFKWTASANAVDATGEAISAGTEYYGKYDPSLVQFVYTSAPTMDVAEMAKIIIVQPESGADTIALKPLREFETDYGIAVNDYYFAEATDFATFNTGQREKVDAIDTTAGTITMSGAADVNAENLPFDWWIRQPPANEATR